MASQRAIPARGNNDLLGFPNFIDLDSDGDGMTDVTESGITAVTYANGMVNGCTLVNGWCVTIDNLASLNLLNSDGTNRPDVYDLDSDDDGIADVIESLGTDANGDGILDNYADTDGDGISDNVDASNAGLGKPDFDGDGVPNYLDLDADNDGIPDIIEAFGTDANNDGRVDGFTDTDNDGWSNTYDGDADGNGVVENAAGVLILTGADTNNDGKPESYTGRGNTDLLGFPNFIDLDSDGDGMTDVTESGITAVTYANGMVNGCTLVNGWCITIDNLASLNLIK